MATRRNDRRIKSKNKKRKMKTWKKVCIMFLLIILVAGGVFAYQVVQNGGGISGVLATLMGHNEETKKNLEEFKVLILGISTDLENSELTDTIMVASYNPNTQKAALLSIPRDTYTGNKPSTATASEKINTLYSQGGAEATLKEVNEITGLNIKYYVVIKTEALIKLVDAIGGVTFNVPIDMDYDDTSQNLHIHLEAGEQVLDGEKAEQLVRFRHNNDGTSYPEEYGDNDTGRMRTQREFILQVLKQTLKPENIFKIGNILEIAHENVITNIDLNFAKDYIPYAVEFNTDNLVTETLPGSNTDRNSSRVWVFVHDEEQTALLIQELFNNVNSEEALEENTTQSNSTSINTDSSTVSKSTMKLEVLNGSGDSKKLQKAIDELEGAGYNVSRTGSSKTTSKTTIVNKTNISEALLRNIKSVLGTGSTSSNTEVPTSDKVDVSIIIGQDYK